MPHEVRSSPAPGSPEPGGPSVLRAAVLGIVAVCLASAGAVAFPRTSGLAPHEADVAARAERAAGEVGFSPSVPSGLPEGWTVTSARVRRSTHGLAAWHVGYRSAGGHFVGLDQVIGLDERWVTVQVAFGLPTGTRRIDRDVWILRERDVRGTVGLVHTGSRVTTVVTGHATPDELDVARAEAERLASALGLPGEAPAEES